MLYRLLNKTIVPLPIEEAKSDESLRSLGIFLCQEAEQVLPAFGLNMHLMQEALRAGSMLFESHEGFDLLCLRLPGHALLPWQEKVVIYHTQHTLLFFCSSEAVREGVIRALPEDKDAAKLFHRFLYIFFEKMTIVEVDYFDRLEQEISDVESALLSSQKRDFVKEIVSLRKHLLSLKRHYEQLLELLDELQQNENELLTTDTLRYFKIFTGKVERHYHNIETLRDYVTQVRESYQAQVDIDLNSIMKVFTVITTVFLPLTLIVGWYGMNLNLPEYQWHYAYPGVIVLSAAVALLSILYFKKKQWF